MKDHTSMHSKSLLTCHRRQRTSTASQPASASKTGRVSAVARGMSAIIGVSLPSALTSTLALGVFPGVLFASGATDAWVREVEFDDAHAAWGDLDHAEAESGRALDQAPAAGGSARAGVVPKNPRGSCGGDNGIEEPAARKRTTQLLEGRLAHVVGSGPG